MSKTIVHADDSAAVRRWVAEQLNDLNLRVVSVSDGEAALSLLRESHCDLLLTDLEMPNLDGLARSAPCGSCRLIGSFLFSCSPAGIRASLKRTAARV